MEQNIEWCKNDICPQCCSKWQGIEEKSKFDIFLTTASYKLSNALSLVPIWCFNQILQRKMPFFLLFFWLTRATHPLTGFISGCFTQKTPTLVGDFRDSKGGLSSVGLSCNKTKWNREIFPKFDLDDFRYRIRIPNHSRTPKISFFGHISIFWTISATLRKIDFLILKITKVAMCGFCHFLPFGAIFCSMWPKFW